MCLLYLVVHVDCNHCWAYGYIDSDSGENIQPKKVAKAVKRKLPDQPSASSIVVGDQEQPAKKQCESSIKTGSTDSSPVPPATVLKASAATVVPQEVSKDATVASSQEEGKDSKVH
jgi:hypothetical protein